MTNIAEGSTIYHMPDEKMREEIASLGEALRNRELRTVYVKTYGCQQNVSDSEKIKGIFKESGCVFTDAPEKADVIVLNTCAVRKTAEDRVFGHMGALKKLRETKKNALFMLGGCMVQQEHIASRIKESYPYIDILFNTNNLERLPGLIIKNLESASGVFGSAPSGYAISEQIPVFREGGYRAMLPIMYGCENHCSYCVVPLVRGPERSRKSIDIADEFKRLVDDGYKDIMLLGQNVNSYGRYLDEDVDLSELLYRLNRIDGDFIIRFMTSHPKDATAKLFSTIADCEKVSRNIHLPVQSGSDRILKEMNRGYTKENYLALIEEARRLIEGVTFTSDILIGFPGETEEDYGETVDLVEKARFYSLFTFIYSKREGTKASMLPDDIPRRVKADRLIALTELQDSISEIYDSAAVGRILKGIVTERIKENTFEVRLDNNAVIVASGFGKEGEFCKVRADKLLKRRLYGEIV